MSSLPKTPFSVHGGCFCKAITYTISIPAFESRPLLDSDRHPPKHAFGAQTNVAARLPVISLDHCNSCRRISGAIIQAWFICPQRWATFSLLARNTSSDSNTSEERITPKTTAEVLRPSKELEEATYIKVFDSSEQAHRTFCGRCGTPLSFLYSGLGDEMSKEENWGPYFDIALGTLEKESAEIEGMRPGRQGWLDDGIGWVKQVFDEGGKSLGIEKVDTV
jgi:hypothetical protein